MSDELNITTGIPVPKPGSSLGHGPVILVNISTIIYIYLRRQVSIALIAMRCGVFMMLETCVKELETVVLLPFAASNTAATVSVAGCTKGEDAVLFSFAGGKGCADRDPYADAFWKLLLIAGFSIYFGLLFVPVR